MDRIKEASPARAVVPSTDGTCHRCGGLLVNEWVLSLSNDAGNFRFPAKRCVQCGELVDAVILRNRVHPVNLGQEKRRRSRPSLPPR